MCWGGGERRKAAQDAVEGASMALADASKFLARKSDCERQNCGRTALVSAVSLRAWRLEKRQNGLRAEQLTIATLGIALTLNPRGTLRVASSDNVSYRHLPRTCIAVLG